ncbi:MAG: pyruvate carboxyltransferase [Thermodesulfobacteriota bacterium]
MHGLIDTTLREGAQTVGVSFDLAAARAMVDGLVAVGVEEIELGWAAAQAERLAPLLAHARRRSPATRLALWCRCLKADIRQAAALGPDVLALSLPVSDRHLVTRLGRSREWAVAALEEAVAEARRSGGQILALGLEDATRADEPFLLAVAERAATLGVQRLRLADTVGVASPARIAGLIRRLAAVPCQLAVHTHNDFGMATANAVAALEAGAAWADVTVLGLGERAGLARLEEVAAFAALHWGRAYDLAALAPLCRTVAAAAGSAIPPAHPVVGERVFACETGLHLQGLYADPATYEPFPPERVGGQRRLLLGAKAGRRAVAAALSRLGRPVANPELASLTGALRRLAGHLHRPLSDAELLAAAGQTGPHEARCGTGEPCPRPG